MKPCSKYQKQIAWLAMGALDDREATAVREHISCCQGCRRYSEEMSTVTNGLTSVTPNSELEASESFHRRVARRLESVESISVLEKVADKIRGMMMNWRVGVPVCAAMGMAIFSLILVRDNSQPFRPTVAVVSQSNPENDFTPTIANYQVIAGQSLEKLSAMLAREGAKRLPPAPVYTASSLKLVDGSF